MRYVCILFDSFSSKPSLKFHIRYFDWRYHTLYVHTFESMFERRLVFLRCRMFERSSFVHVLPIGKKATPDPIATPRTPKKYLSPLPRYPIIDLVTASPGDRTIRRPDQRPSAYNPKVVDLRTLE